MSDNELKKNIELKNKDDVIIKYEKDKQLLQLITDISQYKLG